MGESLYLADCIAPASHCLVSSLPSDLGEDIWVQQSAAVAVREPARLRAISRRLGQVGNDNDRDRSVFEYMSIVSSVSSALASVIATVTMLHTHFDHPVSSEADPEKKEFLMHTHSSCEVCARVDRVLVPVLRLFPLASFFLRLCVS